MTFQRRMRQNPAQGAQFSDGHRTGWGDPGPISPQMMQVILDLWREERLTHRTGLSWMGVEDVDGEIANLSVEIAERAQRFPESSADERQYGQDFWNELARQEQ